MDAAPVDDDVARNEAPDIPFHDPRIEGFNREDRAATLKHHAYYWLRRQDRFWHAPPAELPPPREPTALPAGRETALALALSLASVRDLLRCACACSDWRVIAERSLDDLLCGASGVAWVPRGTIGRLVALVTPADAPDEAERYPGGRHYTFGGLVGGLASEDYRNGDVAGISGYIEEESRLPRCAFELSARRGLGGWGLQSGALGTSEASLTRGNWRLMGPHSFAASSAYFLECGSLQGRFIVEQTVDAILTSGLSLDVCDGAVEVRGPFPAPLVPVTRLEWKRGTRPGTMTLSGDARPTGDAPPREPVASACELTSFLARSHGEEVSCSGRYAFHGCASRKPVACWRPLKPQPMDRRQRTSLLKRLGGMRRHAEAIHAVEEHFFWDLALVAHFVLEGGRWRRSHYSLQRDAFENEIPEDLAFPSLAALVASLVSDCDDATTMLLARPGARPRAARGAVEHVLLTLDAAYFDDDEEAEATFGYTYVHLERGRPLRCRTTAPGADLDAFQPCAVSELDAKLGPTVEPELEPGDADGTWACRSVAAAELVVVAAAPLARDAPHAPAA